MKKISLLLLLLVFASRSFSADIYDDVSAAFKSGDSHAIASYFGNTIELSLLGQEEVYSRAQAEMILKDFFTKNNAKAFSLLHKGASKEGMMYGIGTLQTAGGKNYRVSFYLKNSDGKAFLQELRIEQE